MIDTWLRTALTALLVLICQPVSAADRPNVVFIVADDMGYADMGQLAPTSITQSGVEGIATRHGYRIEQLELSLFNLDIDLGERHNVAAEHPDVVKRLSVLADEARRELGDSLQAVKGTGLRAPGIDLPKESTP